MTKFQKTATALTYDWWKRLLFFLILLLVVQYILSFTEGLLSLDVPLVNDVFLVLVVFIPSAIIEYLRPNSKIIYLGFFWDKITKINLNSVIIITLTTLVFCAIFFIIIGAKVELSNNLQFSGILFLAVSFFLRALAEELLFRGIILQTLIERFGELSAAISISLIFALMHLFNPSVSVLSVFNLFLSGLVISFLFIQTRSIIIVTVYHFIWNAFQFFILGWNVSGIAFYYNIFYFDKINLPVWLSGGDFGLEASPLLIVLMFAHAYLFYKYLKKSPFVSSLILKREYLKPEYN